MAVANYCFSSTAGGKDHHFSWRSLVLLHVRNGIYTVGFFSVWLFLIFHFFPANPNSSYLYRRHNGGADEFVLGQCPPDIARVYVYDLPAKFNSDLIRNCRSLNVYTDMCPHVTNGGLGRPIPPIFVPTKKALDYDIWYATHQFIAEMIFHARVYRHPCRTHDPNEAELFYTPFYAGLYASSVFRQAQLTDRDGLAEEFTVFILQQKTWQRHNGNDHFLVTGRTAWDFMRDDRNGSVDFGANRLFVLPELLNMTFLTVERQPWSGRNQFGIPYPSYLHPFTFSEVTAWQEMVRRSHRTHLFSFVGGPRKGIEKAAVREQILRQCGASPHCLRSECEPGSAECHEPSKVLGVMLRSEFCLQPPGDSFTRRSVFDSILAGCVPVFFSKHTAYTQYSWFLPEDPGEYSVFVDVEKWETIEDVLMQIPESKKEEMQSRVVELIPTLTYAHPNSSGLGFQDAVDVALAHLTRHVRGKSQKSSYA